MRTRSKAALTAPVLLLSTALVGAGPWSQTDPPKTEVTYLRQNWDQIAHWGDRGRSWFYHATQGTRVMPMAWFLALERPGSDAPGTPDFAASENLARFGFLPDPKSDDYNPHGLPVGFAEDPAPRDAEENEKWPAMGLTCAACHTGQLEHGNTKLRIDGGPAMVDFESFSKGLVEAVRDTLGDKPRFRRFAVRVLGSSHSPDGEDALRRLVGEWLAGVSKVAELTEKLRLHPVEEGPGRLDALGRGANIVFGEAIGDARNFAPADAPVSYPALWDTPWFKWAEYNASISQPMARNVSEALGVRADVALGFDGAKRFKSSVRMRALEELEAALSGEAPPWSQSADDRKKGLRAPPWPEALGKIVEDKAARGRAHYERLCAGCHTGWPGESELGRPEMLLTMVELQTIGTDPKVANNFAARTVHLPWEPGAPVPAAEALRRVTNGVMNRWYAENGAQGNGPVPPEERWKMSGRSDNEWRAPRAYRARPLDGVWATAPYLHNGSVPNLFELLSPLEERSKEFRVGSREFDPKDVGFDKRFDKNNKDHFVFDTSLPGNSNRGHEFRDGPRGDGVIGPRLSEDERYELVEYLKILGDPRHHRRP